MDIPIWNRSIPFLLVYFAPVFIGAYRRFQGKEKSWPVWGLFLVVFLTGWSVIGWLFALRKAFKDIELPWDKVLNAGGGSASGWTPPAASGDAAARPSPCMACGGSGTSHCYVCSGRGAWFDSDNLQRTCPSCGARGKITCGPCGGSGRAGGFAV